MQIFSNGGFFLIVIFLFYYLLIHSQIDKNLQQLNWIAHNLHKLSSVEIVVTFSRSARDFVNSCYSAIFHPTLRIKLVSITRNRRITVYFSVKKSLREEYPG